ncbi:hypothetical protein [Methylobacterium aquaticum]|nr:hypothetical protein [Methylobacterium aquaticum]
MHNALQARLHAPLCDAGQGEGDQADAEGGEERGAQVLHGWGPGSIEAQL